MQKVVELSFIAFCSGLLEMGISILVLFKMQILFLIGWKSLGGCFLRVYKMYSGASLYVCSGTSQTWYTSCFNANILLDMKPLFEWSLHARNCMGQNESWQRVTFVYFSWDKIMIALEQCCQFFLEFAWFNCFCIYHIWWHTRRLLYHENHERSLCSV